MSKRKVPLATGEIYHVFTKSIAGYEIFRSEQEFMRMINLLKYYQTNGLKPRYSYHVKEICEYEIGEGEKLVQTIAHCVMPTHLHLILKQLEEEGISIFMNNILNSYTRYFNIKHKRKGPLWEYRFKNVLVESDEQLLHLTRYLHLNPTSAFLVDKPEEWEFSSYKEYLSEIQTTERICEFADILDINPILYRKFVEDRKDYQRELAKIKKLIFE